MKLKKNNLYYINYSYMFTKKHKYLLDQLKQYSDLCHKDFEVHVVEPSYPFHIKNLNLPGSQLYLGKDFILIELYWRNQPHIGKNEIYNLIYSILDLIAYECDTEFANDRLNPNVNIKGIEINYSAMDLKSFSFEGTKDNVYTIRIDYEDLNKSLIRNELWMYEIEIMPPFKKDN